MQYIGPPHTTVNTQTDYVTNLKSLKKPLGMWNCSCPSSKWPKMDWTFISTFLWVSLRSVSDGDGMGSSLDSWGGTKNNRYPNQKTLYSHSDCYETRAIQWTTVSYLSPTLRVYLRNFSCEFPIHPTNLSFWRYVSWPHIQLPIVNSILMLALFGLKRQPNFQVHICYRSIHILHPNSPSTHSQHTLYLPCSAAINKCSCCQHK